MLILEDYIVIIAVLKTIGVTGRIVGREGIMEKTELKNKTVLAMYDVRGIQKYIFRTNKIKEIIGASNIVENIIIDGLQDIINRMNWDPELYITDWEEDANEEEFLKNEKVQMQVMFIGGGNAYVLFRQGETCGIVNRELAKYVLENTYSLNLAAAVVEKTDDYKEDYRKINLEMRKIKATMPETRPLGALPFMHADSITGFPLTKYDYSTGEYISTENALKRKCFPETEKEKPEKILDNMVTKKGDNSNLAVIHIDGNNMGKRIQKIMEEKKGYKEAILAMRRVSRNIKNSFESSFHVMCAAIDDAADRVRPDRKGALYRKIILAGDDITFICNVEVALLAVETFLKDISERYLYEDCGQNEEQRQQAYGFSACAGIAVFNSHFPFSDAYMVAESCCESAKKAAKKAENRSGGKPDGNIGNYVDFQICTNINAVDLEAYRERHYAYADGSGSMIARPYYVPVGKAKVDSGEQNGNQLTNKLLLDLNERNQKQSIDNLWDSLKGFTQKTKQTGMSRSRAKRLRNAYALGMNKVDETVTFLKSRDVIFPKTDKRFWYDALEIMDICILKEEAAESEIKD